MTRSQESEIPPGNDRLDEERSALAADLIGAQRKECWRNAVMALLVDPALSEGVYVESYAAWPTGLRLPVHHGWVELPDGTVVDPTAHVVGHGAPTFYRGAVFTAAQVKQYALTERRTLPLAD
jgi:hypothetical protein